MYLGVTSSSLVQLSDTLIPFCKSGSDLGVTLKPKWAFASKTGFLFVVKSILGGSLSYTFMGNVSLSPPVIKSPVCRVLYSSLFFPRVNSLSSTFSFFTFVTVSAIETGKVSSGWYESATSGFFFTMLSGKTKSPAVSITPPNSKASRVEPILLVANCASAESPCFPTINLNTNCDTFLSINAVFPIWFFGGGGTAIKAKSRRRNAINMTNDKAKFPKALTTRVNGRVKGKSNSPSALSISWEVDWEKIVPRSSAENFFCSPVFLLEMLVNLKPSLEVQSKWLCPAAACAGAIICGPQPATARNETGINTICKAKLIRSTGGMAVKDAPKVKGASAIKTICIAIVIPASINGPKFQPNHQQLSWEPRCP